MLTNKEGNDFTITELEVWEVKFIVIYNIMLINIGLRERESEKEREHTQATDSICYHCYYYSKNFTLYLFI